MGFSLAVAESLTLSSTVAGALGGGCHVHSECGGGVCPCSGRDGVGGWAAGRWDGGQQVCGACRGRDLWNQRNDGRNSDGMGRGARPGKFRGGREGRGGKPGFTSSGKLTPGTTGGVGRLRLGRTGRLGRPAGKGIRPGNVVVGFIGGIDVRDWFTCGGNNGTVGTPVLRTLLTAGGVELIESPDRLCSISVVPGGDKDGD